MSFEKAILSLLILGGVLFPYPCLAQVDTVWTRDHLFFQGSDFVINDIAFGSDGSVYGTGEIICCGDGSSWGSIRYTPAGEELWASGPDLPSPGHSAQALALDATGAVYATDGSRATIKYSPSGHVLWTQQYGDWGRSPSFRAHSSSTWGGGVAVDDSGYAYVLTGQSMTIKFTPQGDTLWTRTFLNSPTSGLGRALAVSPEGKVWVLGEVENAGSHSDVVIIHYSSQGDTIWTRYFNGAANGDDTPGALTLDDSGNAYITGSTRTSATSSSYCTIKYTPMGDTSWVRLYADSASGFASSRDVKVDLLGQVYVTGTVAASGSAAGYATIKYSPTGEVLWVRKLPTPDWWVAYALALDKSGSVYVTGISSTVKYSPDGELLWSHRVAGHDILVDDSGYVYVAGYFSALTKLSQVDSDTDGAIDLYDNCAGIPNPTQSNGDDDSLGDACDNCLEVTNPGQSTILTGDVNQTGTYSSADIISLVNSMFKGGPAPAPCSAAGDTNCDGVLTSADIVKMVPFIFKGGPPPCSVCQTHGLNWSCP